ncbi:MAG: RidA family protein [Alphaproteobacteria bacterium]|nr:RidA family protein [Alphaproteobacteria bacterium]
MAETTPPKPAFALTRRLLLPGGAKLVFCSGVTARGSTAETQGVEAQAEECFACLTCALAQEGGSVADVLKLNTYLSDMRDYAGFDAVRRRILAPLAVPPASTCVGGASFTTPLTRLEIEAIAVIGAAA